MYILYMYRVYNMYILYVYVLYWIIVAWSSGSCLRTALVFVWPAMDWILVLPTGGALPLLHPPPQPWAPVYYRAQGPDDRGRVPRPRPPGLHQRLYQEVLLSLRAPLPRLADGKPPHSRDLSSHGQPRKRHHCRLARGGQKRLLLAGERGHHRHRLGAVFRWENAPGRGHRDGPEYGECRRSSSAHGPDYVVLGPVHRSEAVAHADWQHHGLIRRVPQSGGCGKDVRWAADPHDGRWKCGEYGARTDWLYSGK